MFINLVQNNYNNNMNHFECVKCVGCTHMHTLYENFIAWLATSSLFHSPYLMSSRTPREYHDHHLVFMMQDFSQSMTEVLSCEKILLDV